MRPKSGAQLKISLQLGNVTVWLGEPKDRVLAEFATTGLEITLRDNTALVHDQGYTTSYMLHFDSGRLSFADRTWSTEGVEPIQAVINAFSALETHLVRAKLQSQRPSQSQRRLLWNRQEAVLLRGRVEIAADDDAGVIDRHWNRLQGPRKTD
jgi:hypothetical protein